MKQIFPWIKDFNNMMEYQKEALQTIFHLIPKHAKDILEVGSDIPAALVQTLSNKTLARIIGMNPHRDFPNLDKEMSGENRKPIFIRGDGRFLPFDDCSFDVVFSIATLEHVNGVRKFMSEVERVLKPKGIFYVYFNPIWSSAKGHHVYAKSGSKEARFWKEGKNPIPDYAHLYMKPEEMREYLKNSSCDNELIEPIINWIYYDDGINRCAYEDYIQIFNESNLMRQCILKYETGKKDLPNQKILELLKSKYGKDNNYSCVGISAIFRKLPRELNMNGILFILSVKLRRHFFDITLPVAAQMVRRFPVVKTAAKKIKKYIV